MRVRGEVMLTRFLLWLSIQKQKNLIRLMNAKASQYTLFYGEQKNKLLLMST